MRKMRRLPRNLNNPFQKKKETKQKKTKTKSKKQKKRRGDNVLRCIGKPKSSKKEYAALMSTVVG